MTDEDYQYRIRAYQKLIKQQAAEIEVLTERVKHLEFINKEYLDSLDYLQRQTEEEYFT